MHIGICCSFKQSGDIQSSADFVEENVQRLLVGESDTAAFKSACQGAGECGLPIPVANCFVPAHLKTVGPERNLDRLVEYTRTVVTRAQSLAIRKIVFGSGSSRRRNDGPDRTTAGKQFAEILAAMAPVAAAHDVTIVIEPLNRKECDFINSLAEGAAIVNRVNHPNIRLLADIYHMKQENEGPDDLLPFASLIHHVHIAEGENRTAPGVAGDDFRPWLAALSESGYHGDLSIEAKWGDDFAAEATTAVASLHRQMREVGLPD